MTFSKVPRVFPVSICVLFICCLMMFAGCSQGGSAGSASSNSGSSASSEAGKAVVEGPYASGIHHAVVKVAGYDEFTIEINADEAWALMNEYYHTFTNFDDSKDVKDSKFAPLSYAALTA